MKNFRIWAKLLLKNFLDDVKHALTICLCSTLILSYASLICSLIYPSFVILTFTVPAPSFQLSIFRLAYLLIFV